jgi:hypothetical protein
MDLGKHPIVLKNLIWIIFEEIDLMWFKYMWDVDEATCHDMIEIIFMLYIVKSRL